MDEVLVADYEYIRNELIDGDDELIITGYLECMIVHGDSWSEHFKDVDVFNKNPSDLFYSQTPNFVVVKPRTEACGKTDGCESGCWRIMGRDKLIKSKETGKVLGFKKILKFCEKRKPREYKRSWVMEEYRLTNNLNWKQDHVICKIRLLFETEIGFLLTKHFKTTSESLLENEPLPSRGFHSLDPREEDLFYLVMIRMASGEGNDWPSYVTNTVYRLNPLMLVDPLDQTFQQYGTCIFTNETFGTTYKCDGGSWRILHRDRLLDRETGETVGFKKVLKFYETVNVRKAKDVKETWIIEEYRLPEEVMQNKVLCVIKKFPSD